MRAVGNGMNDEHCGDGDGLVDVNAWDLELVHIRGELLCGKNVTIDINVIFKGKVILEDGVSIGANCIIVDSTVRRGTFVKEFSSIEGADVGAGSIIGPYARLRPGSVIGEHCSIGNFVETKQVMIGQRCKINHHSFVGDCTIGDDVTLGAGFITCNHDGAKTVKSAIGSWAYVGSGVQLIAPASIGSGAIVGAGSTITDNVPEKTLALARARQVVKVTQGKSR